MIDYDKLTKKLDEEAVKSLNENGYVWYTKDNRCCYMSYEWMMRARLLKLPKETSEIGENLEKEK